MKTQRESVFQAIQLVLGSSFSNPAVLNSDQRKKVVEIVATELNNGEAAFSDSARQKHDTYEKVRSYTSGMVNNWLNKDTELNGGEKYETKNPGSRAGQGDEVLKNLKALKSQLTDRDHIEAVDAKIKEREVEIAKAKSKTVVIDFDKIPEDLQYLLDNLKAS